MDIGFAWQAFGSKGARGMASVRIYQKLSLHPRDPGPDSSKMNLPLAKAEPISDCDSSSGTMCFKRGMKTCETAAVERS